LMELDHHTDLAYFQLGTLVNDVKKNTNELIVKMTNWLQHHQPSGVRPSTASGNCTIIDASGKVKEYVTWVRLGDEFIKVLAVQNATNDSGTIKLKVTRGFWGSSANAHSSNASVTTVMYHARDTYPGGSAGTIRYALDPSKKSTAQYLTAAYSPIYDGLWLDCFASSPFQGHDAFGNNVGRQIWDFSMNQPYGTAGYVNGQRLLVSRVRKLTSELGATHLYANNVYTYKSAPELLKPGVLLDGGALEGFIGGGTKCGFSNFTEVQDRHGWENKVTRIQNQTQKGLPVMPMIGSCGCGSPSLLQWPKREETEDYAYASFLLAAGTRDALFGTVPYYFRNTSLGPVGGLRVHIAERYFWPIGKPLHTALPGHLSDYATGNCSLSRRFESAIVVVNPGPCHSDNVTLNGTWYDPRSGKSFTTLRIDPLQGHILLSAPLQKS